MTLAAKPAAMGAAGTRPLRVGAVPPCERSAGRPSSIRAPWACSASRHPWASPRGFSGAQRKPSAARSPPLLGPSTKSSGPSLDCAGTSMLSTAPVSSSAATSIAAVPCERTAPSGHGRAGRDAGAEHPALAGVRPLRRPRRARGRRSSGRIRARARARPRGARSPSARSDRGASRSRWQPSR